MEETILVGKRYKDKLQNSLNDLNINVFWMPDNPLLDQRLSGHADLSAINLQNGNIIVSKHLINEKSLVNYLTANCLLNVIETKIQQSKIYPHDVNLCACIVGNSIIHNLRYTDPEVIDRFNGNQIKVNQGYTKCSVCVVDDNSIITADNIIVAEASKADMDVLRIRDGYIDLTGYNYGFIGGATITLKDKILFTGHINKHPDKNRILDFIKSKGKNVAYLSNEPIFDIGGAVTLNQ